MDFHLHDGLGSGVVHCVLESGHESLHCKILTRHKYVLVQLFSDVNLGIGNGKIDSVWTSSKAACFPLHIALNLVSRFKSS